MRIYKISVRSLVEFILRTGDIGGGFATVSRAQEGIRWHQKLQKQAGLDYQKEVVFTEEVYLREDSLLQIEGRADGIFRDEEGRWVIDEIKSTVMDPENFRRDGYPIHWAQAKCYGYLFARQEGLEEIRVRLTYIYTETESVRHFYRVYTIAELEEFWQELILSYQKWILWQEKWRQVRNKTAELLEFPFPAFRAGQRMMSAYVFQAIRDKKRLFLQAPTGIGKTLSALFPGIKSMGQERGEKIFYLTAKNITAQAPLQALRLLRERGLKAKTIVITAKDKICPQTKRQCDADHCPYAKGHFDRINEAVYEALQAEQNFEKATIQRWAEKYQVCPFELSLDLATWADIIVCDYNYAFDPTASLKRFFQGKEQDYILLVDEAHNLVDRGREMFSAGLHKSDFMELRKVIDKEKEPYLYRSIDQIHKLFVEEGKKIVEGDYLVEEEPSEKWYRVLQRFTERASAFLQEQDKNVPDELMDRYFEVLFFLKIWENKDKGYEYYVQKQKKEVYLRFFCVNPAKQLQQTYQLVRSVIFFSATLTPIGYYKTLLSGIMEDTAIDLPSPFVPDHQQVVLLGELGATYQTRQGSVEEACRWIAETYHVRKGHYMVFFPSFAYLRMVQDSFEEQYPDIPLQCQNSEMTEEERLSFLAIFEKAEPVIAFCVLGGVFSEGIDLVGDRLIGAIVVSVGLPQLGLERNLIREHMEQEVGQGFEYAYMYPGLGRVLQAAGRVIRTETDRGVILLLDERFLQERYRRLYPAHWQPEVVRPDNVEKRLKEFWNQ